MARGGEGRVVRAADMVRVPRGLPTQRLSARDAVPGTPSGAHLLRVDLDEAAPSDQVKGQLARPRAAACSPWVAQQQGVDGRRRGAPQPIVAVISSERQKNF